MLPSVRYRQRTLPGSLPASRATRSPSSAAASTTGGSVLTYVGGMELAVGSPEFLRRPKWPSRHEAGFPATPSLGERETGGSSAACSAGARSVDTTTPRCVVSPATSSCLDSTRPTPAQYVSLKSTRFPGVPDPERTSRVRTKRQSL